MRTDLALRNILHDKARALLAIAGIGTAILLMFMQMGFRGRGVGYCDDDL